MPIAVREIVCLPWRCGHEIQPYDGVCGGLRSGVEEFFFLFREVVADVFDGFVGRSLGLFF